MPIKRIFVFLFFVISIQAFAQPVVKRFELNSINFEGNHSFSSSGLSEIIFSRPTPWWVWKFLHSFSSLGKEPVYFDSLKISSDLTSLKDFYTSNGYFNAAFSYRYDVDTLGEKVDLVYIINEGNSSEFGKLQLLGLESLPPYLFNSVYEDAAIDTNKRFSQTVILNNTYKAVNNLQNQGYMFAKYDSTIVIKDTLRNDADISVYFSPGNRYRIDTILINKTGEGAALVDDELLRKITGINQGEIYSLEALRSSQSRLYRTGLFNSVQVTGDVKDTTGSMVPVMLIGDVGLLNELSPEVILNNQGSAFNTGLGFSYARKNFFGNARKLTLSASFALQNFFTVDYGKLIKNFSINDSTLKGYVDTRITINQPYLFNRAIFGTWEIYATIDKQKTYRDRIYGSKVTMDFELPSYTFMNNLSASYTVEQSNEIFPAYNDTSSIFISDIAADASSSTADDILFPTQGYNLSFHIEEANSIPYLFSRVFNYKTPEALFYKIVLTGSYYLPVDRDKHSIFAVKYKVGNIQIYSGDFSGVPINRTFYAGGSNSIRGWFPYDLVPVGSQTVVGTQGVSYKGGTFLMEGSFEIRRKFAESLGFAVFADYGNTWLGYKQFRLDGVAIATGFGFRYFTPVAPFRLDLGFKFYDPNPSNHTSGPLFIWQNWDPHFFKNITFQFGIGEAF